MIKTVGGEFLVSDNDISQIFSQLLNLGKIFSLQSSVQQKL